MLLSLYNQLGSMFEQNSVTCFEFCMQPPPYGSLIPATPKPTMTHANTLISIFCSRILGYHSSPQPSISNSLIQSSNLNFPLAKPASLYYLNLLHISSSFSMRTSRLTLHVLPPST